jgi:hypothetical protein
MSQWTEQKPKGRLHTFWREDADIREHEGDEIWSMIENTPREHGVAASMRKSQGTKIMKITKIRRLAMIARTWCIRPQG